MKIEKATYSTQGLLNDLKLCSIRKDLQWGRNLHEKAMKSQNDSNKYILAALIKMYANCGRMVDARKVFDSIDKPNLVSWNVLLRGYAENGDGLAALEMFSKMNTEECRPSSITYIAAFKACSSLAMHGGLERGRSIHSQIRCYLGQYLQNTLIDMYANCGSMVDARYVFDSIQKPTTVSWNAVLLGYAVNGQGLIALELFSKMKALSYIPDSRTYVAVLKACSSLATNRDESGKGECLQLGRQIHSEVGLHLNDYVQNALIDMYTKCSSMPDARHLFENMKCPNVISWNILLMGYVENGDNVTVLNLFSKMKAIGYVPDSVTYIAAIKACTSLATNGDRSALTRGQQIHSEIGCHLNLVVRSVLLEMYAKSGNMVKANEVFEGIRTPDVVSWTSLLQGYVENGEGLAALDVFSRMKEFGCAPDSVAYVAAIKACSLIGALPLGRKIHSEIAEFTVRIVTCLVDFYAKCGSVVEAREVFDLHKKERGVSTWNALLAGYASIGDSGSVFDLYDAMHNEMFRPDPITFLSILLCCSHAGLVEKSKEYFEAMSMYGATPTVQHYTCMVDVLGRANKLNEAITVLRNMPCTSDVVTWTTLLGACCKWKNIEIGRLALQFLEDMDVRDAYAHILKARMY